MTAARAISLEQLGNIGTKIRQVILESRTGAADAPPSLNSVSRRGGNRRFRLISACQILREGDLEEWQEYQAAMRAVRHILARKNSSALNLTLNRWVLEIDSALRDLANVNNEQTDARDLERDERRSITVQQARSQAAELCHELADEDVFKDL